MARWIATRKALVPFNLGLALMLAATELHADFRPWWPLGVLIGAIGTLGAWRAADSRRYFAHYDGDGLAREERYLIAVGVAATLWLVAAWLFGVTSALAAAWWLLALVAEGYWLWWHRTRSKVVRVGGLRERVRRLLPGGRVRRRTLDDVMASWAAITAGTRAEGSRVLQAIESAAGRGYRLKVGHVRPEDLVAEAGHLAKEFRTRRGGVHVRPLDNRADQAWVTVSHVDPLAEVHACPDPVPGRSIADPIPLGVDATGQEVSITLVPEPSQPVYVLVAGAKGSGKSGALQVLVRHLVACVDVVIWALDLKQGVEFTTWRPRLGRFEDTLEGALDALKAVSALIDARGQALAGSGREWDGSLGPWLVIMIDELAKLSGHMKLVWDIASRGRALGVLLIAATQRPSKETLGAGGTDARAQMDALIGLRLRRGDEFLVFGPEMRTAGWVTSSFKAAGSFLIYEPTQHPEPEPARFYRVTDAQIRADAARYDGRTLALTLPELVPQLPADDSMAEAEPRIVTLADGCAAWGLKPAAAYARFRVLVASGQARKVQPGRWLARL